jgi:hypothetical protein
MPEADKTVINGKPLNPHPCGPWGLTEGNHGNKENWQRCGDRGIQVSQGCTERQKGIGR